MSTDPDIDCAAHLIDGLAALPDAAFAAVASHVRERNTLAIDDWGKYDYARDELCGCLMANGYYKPHNGKGIGLEGGYADEDIAFALAVHFGCPGDLTASDISTVASSYDDWLLAEWPEVHDTGFLNPERNAATYSQLLHFIDAAEAARKAHA